MGRIVNHDPPPVRKALPARRPARQNPAPPPIGSRAGVKFIQTLSQDDFSSIAEEALRMGMTVQNYIRFFIVRPWREAREE